MTPSNRQLVVAIGGTLALQGIMSQEPGVLFNTFKYKLLIYRENKINKYLKG